ncbi:MAG: hypothetical protein U5L45_17340 [Saprospiraceae bacterium]|nr:hypothetical protein [Saprospiraceae bacterium]
MTNRTSFLVLVAMFFCSSCASFYQPAPALTPILKNKGDANAFISLKDAQLAYALTDHIGVTLSGHYDTRKQSFFSDTAGVIAKLLDNKLENIESKGFKSLQGGVTYFQELDHTKSVQVGVVVGTYNPSMMISVNRGLFKKSTDENLAYKCMKTDMYLNFVHSSKYVNFITSIKMTGIQYNNIVYSEPLVMKELNKMTANQYPTLKTNYFLIEPSATLQYGFDNFKFHMQGFLSQPLKENVFAKMQMGVVWGLNYEFNVGGKKAVSKNKKRQGV